MKRNYRYLLHQDLDHILNHTLDLLKAFQDTRIFITGGTGFFGTWVLETFARANEVFKLNAEIVILSRNPEGFINKYPHLGSNNQFTFITGDVRDFTFPLGTFNYIFHFATEASDDLNRNDPLKMFDVIVSGTRHVLDFAISSGVENLLLASSGAVYGRQPFNTSHVSEEYMGGPDTSNPVSAYGEGKRVAELFGSFYAKKYGLQIKIARCFAFVGPYLPLDKHFAIGNFILNGLKRQPIYIKGDGTPLRSYLYISDLLIWLLTILIKGKNCYPYNVGSDESISIAELATVVSSCFNPSVPVEINQNATKSGNIERYVPSVKRAGTELGLKQHIKLQEALTKTILFNREGAQ